MHRIALLERGANRTVQSVLEVQVALPIDDVGEQVAEVGRVLVKEEIEVQLRLGRHEFAEPHLRRGDLGPVALSESMIGVWPSGIHSFENHSVSLNGSRLAGGSLVRMTTSDDAQSAQAAAEEAEKAAAEAQAAAVAAKKHADELVAAAAAARKGTEADPAPAPVAPTEPAEPAAKPSEIVEIVKAGYSF